MWSAVLLQTGTPIKKDKNINLLLVPSGLLEPGPGRPPVLSKHILNKLLTIAIAFVSIPPYLWHIVELFHFR